MKNITCQFTDWTEEFPELTENQIVKLQSSYCFGCHKDSFLNKKSGFMQCEACSKK